jgi:hypothetical protein
VLKIAPQDQVMAQLRASVVLAQLAEVELLLRDAVTEGTKADLSIGLVSPSPPYVLPRSVTIDPAGDVLPREVRVEVRHWTQARPLAVSCYLVSDGDDGVVYRVEG